MAFGLAAANCDERPVGEFLVFSDGHDGYLADKDSSSVWWEKHRLEAPGIVVAATPQTSASFSRVGRTPLERCAAAIVHLFEKADDSSEDEARKLETIRHRIIRRVLLT